MTGIRTLVFRIVVIACGAIGVCAPSPAWGNVISVVPPPPGSDDHVIQDAVDKAKRGDTVMVYPGDYAGAVITTSEIQVVGIQLLGQRVTITKRPQDRDSAFTLKNISDVQVLGFTFASQAGKDGYRRGIHVFNGRRITIAYNDFRVPIGIDSHLDDVTQADGGLFDSRFILNTFQEGTPGAFHGFILAINMSGNSSGNFVALNRIAAVGVTFGAGVAFWGVEANAHNSIILNTFDLSSGGAGAMVAGVLFAGHCSGNEVAFNDFSGVSTDLGAATDFVGAVGVWFTTVEDIKGANEFRNNRDLTFTHWPE